MFFFWNWQKSFPWKVSWKVTLYIIFHTFHETSFKDFSIGQLSFWSQTLFSHFDYFIMVKKHIHKIYHHKSWLIRKDPDAGKDWSQEVKQVAEDEMVGWHHWLDGHEFEQTPGDGKGQGSLACCTPWSCRVRHDLTTEQQLFLSVWFSSMKSVHNVVKWISRTSTCISRFLYFFWFSIYYPAQWRSVLQASFFNHRPSLCPL